ncbi:hypothetical protein KDK_06090 [Dictyobacter kobayashii]|uniref:Uncharacterized protein n=1 Tax=Dictyobacter kobayashii TaxID=2014872 RepID=A0A402ACJ0_9CHLR|nr:hypothetical protein KDK_06090 [Dictyobacter kobayashii]
MTYHSEVVGDMWCNFERALSCAKDRKVWLAGAEIRSWIAGIDEFL